MIKNIQFMEQLNQYYTAWQEWNCMYEEWAKTNGLSANSLLVLSAIYNSKEECTQKKISQRWLVPKQTVNMILKDFEKQGLVELSPMRTDKRRKTICFTPKGKEYAKTILSKLRKVEMNAIDEMGIERMKRFNEDAALFVKLLGKAEGKNNEI